MDKLTQFFIDLMARPEQLARFNAGETQAQIAANRQAMLSEAGVEGTEKILALSSQELQSLMIQKINEQTAQLSRAIAQTESSQIVEVTGATVCAIITERANIHPGQAAIIDGDTSITYEQFTARARAIASELTARSIQPGSLVGVCMNRTWELPATLLGVLLAGCAYVPLDPAYPRERVRYMLEHSRAKAAIVDSDKTAELCEGVQETLWIDKITGSATENIHMPAGNDLAYVIYTSGSTGKPKGVAIEHKSIVAMTRAMSNILDSQDLKGMLAATSVCFDPSVMEIFGTLTLGGTVVLANNMLDLPALTDARKIKSCVVVPSAIQALLATGWKPEGIRTIVFGSEALKLPLAEKVFALNMGLRVYNAYGPTEDTVFSTSTQIFEGTDAITIGKSVEDSASYILDADMNPVADGSEGELYLAGNQLARGYLYDEERTKERFIEISPSDAIPETRLYKTGDLVRRTPAGNIEFLGRVDQQVKIRGFRVELEEIETALETIEGIQMAAADAVDGGAGQKMLTAYIVSTDEALSDDAIKNQLGARMPRYMVPQVIIRLDELPLLPNGKLDRKQLKTLSESTHTEQVQQNTSTSAMNQEAILLAIQQEVAALLHMDPRQVNADQSFDSFGIDSLSTLELSSRLSKSIGQTVTAAAILEYITPAALTQHLMEEMGSTGSSTKAKAPKIVSETLSTFQMQIQSSHPTFQAAKINAWSADDKSKLVQEVLHMVNDQRRNPYSKVLRTGSATRGMVSDAYNDEEQEAIIWTTNLYLGMNRDKTVMEESAKALQQFGTGMGTSAAASGMTDLHLQFEEEFAELTGKPAACLFPTGYTANVGAVAGLLGKNDVVVIDQLCHASIVDGARLCGATIRTFKHNDTADLEAVLQSEVSPHRSVLVVLEGVYSMGEGAAPVAEIVRTAKKYDALVLVDEAHSFGFYGKRGAGICAEQGITDQVDFIMTTLSKALGSLGGVVSAKQEHVNLLKASSRAYIFQASVSPADMAAALTSLRRLREDDSLRERLWDTTRYMRKAFTDAGYDLGTGDGPIVTPHFSDKDKLYAIVQAMYKRGVQTSAVTYPIVEPGRGRLRLICSSAHTKEDVDKTLQALIEAEREVDAMLASAKSEIKATAVDEQALHAWTLDFAAYAKEVIAKAPKATPDLAITVKTADDTSMTITVKEQEVSVGDASAEYLPTCTLSISDNLAVTALHNANVQALLQSICDGTCALKGQVEPFTWLIARLVDQNAASTASKATHKQEAAMA